ncbi:MAG: mechanosensitive ion channel family protein [Rhodobacteraceae bacterium]|nr:mechanosensitive ion channel family protein [Paracoccaceae bacterium]
MRSVLLAVIVAVLPMLAVGQIATTPSSRQELETTVVFDKEAFDLLIIRAEEVLDRGEASNEALEQLRSQLTMFRSQATNQKQLSAAKVRPVQERLIALGNAPPEGETEPQDLASLRTELTKEVERLRTPVIAAEDASQRADNQIERIDALIRSRATDALLERGPSPMNPVRWWSALGEIREYFRSVAVEFNSVWVSDARRAARISNAPIVLILTGIALLLLFRARRWSRLAQEALSDGVCARWAAGLGLIGALLQLVLPALGLAVLIQAIIILDIFAERGYFLVRALGMAGFSLYFATWVSRILFVPRRHMPTLIEVDNNDRRMLRNAFLLLGVVFAARQMLMAIAGTVGTEPRLWEATNTLMFPVVILGGIAIFRIGYTLRRLALGTADAQGGNPFLARISALMGLFCIVAGLLGPIASAVGYAEAGSVLVFSTALSLLLIAGFYILFRLIGMMGGSLATQVPARAEEDRRRYGALFQVSLGFFFICASVPLLALIWGARQSQILEVWLWLRDGIPIGETRISLIDSLTFVLVFSIGYMITRLLQSALRTTVMPNTRLDIGGQNAIVTGTGYVGIFVAALAAIGTTGLDLSNLAIVAGALSVGIGFGLQTIVSNFVSGIILLIERPIKEGDWIDVGGYSGYVRNISVRSTEIETFDRANVIIPNADLIAGSVTNWTHSSMAGRVIVPVGVGYGSDPRHVERVLREVAESHPMVLLNPAPAVMFMRFGADSLDFEIRAILRDVNWMMSARSDMNYEITRRFREEGIEIPFAQRDVHIRNLDDLRLGQEIPGSSRA